MISRERVSPGDGPDGVFHVIAPFRSGGYEIISSGSESIRGSQYSPVDHLPIDPTPEAFERVKKTAENEGRRALAIIQREGIIDPVVRRKRIREIIQLTRKNGVEVQEVDLVNGIIDTITYPVPYAFYNSLSKPEFSPEQHRLGNLLAVGVGLVTVDDLLVIQRRSEGDEIYPSMLGTSTGGLSDGRRFDGHPGKNKPVTTATIFEDTRDELDWEIGVQSGDIAKELLVALAEDQRQKHIEAVVYVEIDLTFEELKQHARVFKRRTSPRPGHEFAESFIGVPATIPVIELLLTEIPCPFPFSHIASILGVGFIKIAAENNGQDEVAQEWLMKMYGKIARHYSSIDQRVQDFWKKNPVKRRGYQGDQTRYDPEFPPDTQGLPEPIGALRSRGISVY